MEWLGEENGELRVRVGDEVVRNLVRAENPEKAYIFPVSCTDRFSSVRYDVSEEEAEGRAKEQVTSEGASMITCPMPGSVCRVLVKNGEKVKKGDALIEADLEAIRKDGYDCITPVIICNTTDYAGVTGKTGIHVKPGDACMEIEK